MLTSEHDAFVLIERAAVAGARCPKRDEFPKGARTAIYKLAATGKIKIETYAVNWRVVEIMEGPHAGKRTKPCPYSNDGPWRITDKNGVHYPHQWGIL